MYMYVKREIFMKMLAFARNYLLHTSIDLLEYKYAFCTQLVLRKSDDLKVSIIFYQLFCNSASSNVCTPRSAPLY